MSFVSLVRLWICFAVFASAAGWTLSALGQLNRIGYGIAFVFFVIFLLAGRSGLFAARMGNGRSRMAGHFPSSSFQLRFRAVARRFRRPLPLCFAVLAVLVFIGSVLYPPSNYTGLNYHLARVLQWLAYDQWHWVDTAIVRMNYSGCAFEWLTTPVMLFTQSDRALFLVNFIPFLLLPGLVFSVFTRLGVRAKVAWYWMWLLPTGYNFLLQSGSIGNDAFAAIFALAAIDFGCRAWASRRISDLWLSLLAVALMTGTKPISLPLLLPWLILVFPLLPLQRRHWLPTLPVVILAGLVSFLPMAWLNQSYTGDWLGRSVEIIHLEVHQPLIGILGNACQLLLGNFVPPIFPLAGWWNQHALSLLPPALVTAFDTNFQAGILAVGEVPTEDWVGIGFGLSLLLTVSVLGSFWLRGKSPSPPVNPSIPQWLCRCVRVAAWLSLLAYCMKSGLNTAPRLVTPYYLLLLPLLLAGAGQSQLIRRRWWRGLALGVPGLALIVLILSPDRPLWPAKTILTKVHEQHPDQRQVTRALKVYTVYAERWDALADVRALLPPGLKVVGFLGGEDDCDISLWRPFGERRVEHFQLADSAAQIKARAEYVVVSETSIASRGVTFADWLQKTGALPVASTNAMLKIAGGMQSWQLVRFPKD